MRRMWVGLGAAAVAVTIGAVGVDFGAAIFAEYRLARTVRTEARLNWDPYAGILGFPFVTQAANHQYHEVEIRAAGVDDPVVGTVSLEATLHAVDLHASSWLIGPNAPLPVEEVESRIIIDSRHIGHFMGIDDLSAEAPPKDTNDATGGTTESGISGNRGLVFTGTPKSAGFDKRVSVSVDLSLTGPDESTLTFTATDVLTGAGTAREAVPDNIRDAVLAAFDTTMPGQKLPFGVEPTSLGARGSDIIIEGLAWGVTVCLDEFRQT